MDGGQVVPGVAVVRLLLRAAAEGLERSREVLLLQRAVPQGEPAFRVQRIHPQSQLPVLCCLHRRMHSLRHYAKIQHEGLTFLSASAGARVQLM